MLAIYAASDSLPVEPPVGAGRLFASNTARKTAMINKKQDNQANRTLIQLCGTSGCCPTVEIKHDEKKIVITDDNGGRAILTKEQWREALVKAKVE